MPAGRARDIDRFILAHLEKEGLKPVHAAPEHDLIRRATLDLTGLPPTPEEIAAFEKDTSPDAFAKVVDRLLASPHYGERWGRIWLDVARYGEDDYRSLNPNPRGYHPYPNAYVYRDWVIQAFNDDMPYDQFVKAQIAGDLLDAKIRYKMLPGTGFLGLGPWYYDNGAVEVTRADERHDRVDVVTRGFLGLTVACARCHDHKYDPIPHDRLLLAGRRVSEHRVSRVSDGSEGGAGRVHQAAGGGREEAEDAAGTMQTESELASFPNRWPSRRRTTCKASTKSVGQKKEAETVVESRKLDYELLMRWIKYMEKPTDKYHYKEAWQAMMKKAAAAPGGGAAARQGGGGGAALAEVAAARAVAGAAAVAAAATSTRSQEAGRRIPGQRGQRDAGAQGPRTKRTRSSRPRRWKAPRKRSAPTSPTSSSPTTISAPAAACG